MTNTNQNNQHPFDALALEQGGNLIFTPCPGTKGVDLSTSLQQLKSAGANMIISLTPDSELVKLGVSDFGAQCEQLNLTWLQFPIVDDKGPEQEFAAAWLVAKEQVLEHINAGGSIAVHCKGGSGRTGLIIGLILKALGFSNEQAKQKVQAIRPKALVNPQQLDYFLAH